MLYCEHATEPENNVAARQVVHDALAGLFSRFVAVIRAWSGAKQHYADLRSRARTPAASGLISRIRTDMEEQERKVGKRVRGRREKSEAKLSEAIERFVGDLLRARSGASGPGLVYRAVGKGSFDRDFVKYDTFMSVLEGMKGLDLVGHVKGQSRYRKTEFDPGETVTIPLAGRAARFWPTGTLMRLAEGCGISGSNVGKHFIPEPPLHPLVLRDYAIGYGPNKQRGRRIKYEPTPETVRLEADVRELNEFLTRFKLMGGEHYGYIRVFNNNSWNKGGRLYSDSENNYQQLSEPARLKMTINAERVAEIDIKASQLTIYHAMIGEPLEGSGDPYARAGLDRSIVKKWVVVSFGKGAPATRWPPETIKEYKQETGKDLRKLAKAKDVASKMLETFPALGKLGHNRELWGDLQFRESQAVLGAMLILMRQYSLPSLSMHDGIIVPQSRANLAEAILSREFHRVIGVTPILTVETDAPEEIAATDL